MNHFIKNSNGQTLAVVYYDKPVLEGQSEAIPKINDYFETDYLNWLNGQQTRTNFDYPDSLMERLNLRLSDMAECGQEDILVSSPFEYTVRTDVMFASDEVLSIRQYVCASMDGSAGRGCYGSTFDLSTGDLLPFTYFTDVNADNFRTELLDFLMSKKDMYFYDNYGAEEIRKQLAPNNKHNFEYTHKGEMYDLSYDYYYDGNSIFLTSEPEGIAVSFIIKYEFKEDNQFKSVYVL